MALVFGSGYEPGDLMRRVAQGLTARGLGIEYPERRNDFRLRMTDPAGRPSEVIVMDDGQVLWERTLKGSGISDPKKVADVVTSLLTGRTEDFRYYGDSYGRDRMTLKGVVGRELLFRGLKVSLEIYEEPDVFDVGAAIAVTNPGVPEDATVWVSDSGCITWKCESWYECATTTGEPGPTREITDPAKLADRIVNTIFGAVVASRERENL